MQQFKLDKLAETPDANKMQCLICNRWYRCVCSHSAQRHGISGREYKEMFGLDVGKGINPPDLEQKYHDIGVANHRGINNLKKGAKYRFKKNDDRLKYKRSPQTIERLRRQLPH